MKKKSIKSSRSRIRRANTIWLMILLAGILICGFFLNAELIEAQHTESGVLSPGETYNGENLSHSLDLRLASRASYPSSAFTVVKELGQQDGIRTRIVSFPVPTDGLIEYGLLKLPAEPAPADGYSVIILCHGYVNPQEYITTTGYIADMDFYASKGFAVFKPDFRGQGFSAGQGEANSAFYSMDYNIDVMSAISAIKETKYIDSSNINLWGHSMGAYIALRASVTSSDIKNTILLSGPVGSFKNIYLSYVAPSDENNLAALKTRQAIFSKYGTPAENTTFWKNASPTNFVKQISANVQIHSGQLDAVVPPQLSADLDAAFTKAGVDHQYYIYQDGLHSLFAQRDFIWSRSLAVLQKK